MDSIVSIAIILDTPRLPLIYTPQLYNSIYRKIQQEKTPISHYWSTCSTGIKVVDSIAKLLMSVYLVYVFAVCVCGIYMCYLLCRKII